MFKFILSILMLVGNSYAFDFSKSICGVDNRIPSQNPVVARTLSKMTDRAGCSATLIGRSCILSAGHCRAYLKIAEFNTPESIGGKIRHPGPQDIYQIVEGSLKYRYAGIGSDWAVARLDKNKVTGKYPGDVQGHYEVSYSAPAVSDIIRITGYGEDRADDERNFAQQTHTGTILNVRRASTALNYDADTMGGNSGSAVIIEGTTDVIGVHTNGGCSRNGGYNLGTMIYGNTGLIEAIKSCLQAEQNL